jgi:hypothetical protein
MAEGLAGSRALHVAAFGDLQAARRWAFGTT